MSRILFLIFFLSSAYLSFGQSLSGKVADQNGQPVVFAKVYIKNTQTGTLTNQRGEYRLELKEGDYLIVFQHLNYGDKTIEVEISGNEKLNISLNTIDLQLGVVEIKGGKKDPAYGIMQKAIANKKAHLKNFETYTAETYLKLTLEVDTLPSRKEKKKIIDSLGVDSLPVIGDNKVLQNFIESSSTTYFKAPKTYKSIVHGYRDYKNIKKGSVQVSFWR